MASLGRFAVRYRYFVIAFWLVLAVICIGAFPSLSSVAQTDNSSFLPGSAPIKQAGQLATPFQPASGSIAALVAVREGGALTADDQTTISAVETAIGAVPRVTIVRDQGMSADGSVRRALVAVDAQPPSVAGRNAVDTIRATFTANAVPQGLALHLTGQLASNVDTARAAARANRITQIASNLVILLMLFITYRAVVAPFVTLIPAVLVLALAGPVIAQGSLHGLQVSSVTQAILTVLMLGAGTDYGLFLILRMREELRRGHEPKAAVVQAVTHVGESISFSAGTVIGALLCLLIATFGLYRGLGPALAIGVGLMLLAALTLLPALLAILGNGVFWPGKIVAGEEPRNGWGHLAGRIVEHPVITLVSGLVLFGGLALGSLGFASGGFHAGSAGPGGSDSALGSAALAGHFPPAIANPMTVLLRFPTSVWADLSVVQQAQQQLGQQPVFTSVNGLLNPNGTPIPPAQLASLYQQLGPPAALPPTPPTSAIPAATYNAYRASAQFVSPDGRTVQFFTTLAAGDPSSPAALQATPDVRRAIARIATTVGATESGLTGQAAVAYDVSSISSTDLRHILPVVLVLIALLLGVVMRSLVAPVYLVLSVVLSYFATLGLAVLIFMVIGGAGGLNFVLPFLMFVFLMALGEDYNILVMSRIREEAKRRTLHDAIAHALNATGTTVTSAGMILAATFGVAGILASTDQLRQLGIGIALGVLLDTFLVRTLLVPSVVVLLGRWNWWPSALARPAPTPPIPESAAPEPGIAHG
jgi:RND superfamily putative drug exporter